MKKIIIWCIALCVAASLYGQKQQQSSQKHNQISEATIPTQTSKLLIEKIIDINNQIDSLKKELHKEYHVFREQKFYINEKYRNDSLASIEKGKVDLQKRIDENKVLISALENEYKAVDNIRKYYENGNIDTLYMHADRLTLDVHKNIFGESYPKVMDDLHILLECADLLTQEYDEKQNKACIQRLKGVRKCATKDLLEGFLLVQKDVTDEVNSWIKDDDEHTLHSLAVFRRYLCKDYGITLDEAFPYLSAKVIEMVKLPSTTK